ncbi:MAG TPA: hypothetical protein PKC28_02810, partial [Bdellovibrionales bacterium]|nr:hypothetical protein [Bdellovibrionales bacterium]
DGTFSVTLPRGAASYTLYVTSRSYNQYLQASVLNQPEIKAFYAIGTTVSAAASAAIGTLTATANGDTVAGAFNILDQLYEANEYIRGQVSNCSATYSGCLDVNFVGRLPKVEAYWRLGFNPNSYYGADDSGVSFYIPGYPNAGKGRLFILGGINGDTASSDTDHFDNSVIVHEYGHFLEDSISKSDSPGGSHNGNKIIDPRLAWSEGWGNFLQAAVRGQATYQDSIGNVDGDTELAFDVNLETATLGSDRPAHPGEGNFREFAISRMLWDAIDTNGEANTAQFQLQTVADTGGNLSGRYFYFSTLTADYVAYLDAGAAVAPSIPGRTAVQVSYTSGNSATLVATAIANAIDALPDVSASNVLNVVTVTGDANGATRNPRDVSTSFTFAIVRQGADDDVNAGSQFAKIWAAITKSTNGFASGLFAFRNVGQLHLAQSFLTSAGDWANVRATNHHAGDTRDYAEYVKTGGACGSYSIDPDSLEDTSTSLSGSNLFWNNNFYYLNVASAGTYTIQLQYIDADSSGTEADLDLFVYDEDAVFGSTSSMRAYSRVEPNAGYGTETETVSVSLAAGRYLINVNAYTGGGRGAAGPTNYTLSLNGSSLCPSALVQ